MPRTMAIKYPTSLESLFSPSVDMPAIMEHEDDVEFDTTPPDCMDEYEDTTEGYGLKPAASVPAPPSSCHGGTMQYACCAKDLCRRA